MSDDVLTLSGDIHEETPALCSYIYTNFAKAFQYPDDNFYQWLIIEGGFEKLLAAVAILDEQPLKSLQVPDDLTLDVLQTEYTRLFDVGLPEPPCPIHSNFYIPSKTEGLEELLRFYNYFGLSCEEKSADMFDHICTQLEFLHFLSHKEWFAVQHDESSDGYHQAKKDFIERQVSIWLPVLQEKLIKAEADYIYQELTDSLCRMLKWELP